MKISGKLKKIKAFKMKWLRLALSLVVLGSLVAGYHLADVQGEGRLSPFVMIRLEDIGPGGQYASIEQLGKLRAVLDYLKAQGVAYHIGMIPRWIDYPKDGPAYDVRLDQPDDPYTAAFRKVLHEAADGNATLGMHGYTHQVGSSRRDDGHHESGIGNEFDVTDVPATQTPAFAEERVKEGLDILNKAGLIPQFWEAPHYHTNSAQDAVFRSYFGLNYQAEVQSHRNAPDALFWNKRNTGYGESTLGAAYVPTPFDYIPYNKDEKVILDRIGKSQHIPSFFYHPFLEFKQLNPVINEDGEAVYRDGIPVYQYPGPNKSVLQRLITGLKAKGYTFYSIQDYVPFTPAHHVAAGAGVLPAKLLLGDAYGSGQKDAIYWSESDGGLYVEQGKFRLQRNTPPGPPVRWGRAEYKKGSAAAVSGPDSLGPCSLWTAGPNGKLQRFTASGNRFELKRSWNVEARSWSSLYAMPLNGGDTLIAGLTQERRELYGWLIHNDEMKPLKPYKFRSELRSDLQPRMGGNGTLFTSKEGASDGIEFTPDADKQEWKLQRVELEVPNETGRLYFGDFNGDGLEDVIRWNKRQMIGTVYLRTAEGGWKLLSGFGPWGDAAADLQLLTVDLNGNGKSDLVLENTKTGELDAALSFIRQ
ncbi:DUF2334 domain-containing protein [Paenibacillus filicis]|uniref:DUF2334 domain-containing protein n=1 Tax=Paenibacillus filicis TaxID=669464 RepID=A0ABU9DDF3_9BACL